MSKKANKRLASLSPDINGDQPKALLDFIIDDGRDAAGGGCHLKPIERSFACQLVKRAHSRVARFFHRVRVDMANALRSRPPRRKITRQPPPAWQPLATARRVSASMSPQSFVPSRDSHQFEAVEDCIKFLNSSSRREIILEDSSANLHFLLHNQQYCF